MGRVRITNCLRCQGDWAKVLPPPPRLYASARRGSRFQFPGLVRARAGDNTQRCLCVGSPAFRTRLSSTTHSSYFVGWPQPSLAIREKAEPDDWRTFNTRAMLGGSLVGQKKHAEAEFLLLHGYAGMKQRENQIHALGKRRLTEALQYLVELYTALEKPEKAAKWHELLSSPSPAASAEHHSSED